MAQAFRKIVFFVFNLLKYCLSHEEKNLLVYRQNTAVICSLADNKSHYRGNRQKAN